MHFNFLGYAKKEKKNEFHLALPGHVCETASCDFTLKRSLFQKLDRSNFADLMRSNESKGHGVISARQ